ncbi:hypothetical protein E4T39_00497 [Aureobasidium subglaciale]|nr:hypothetical protein E4T39_00497 [Aureobasidium subglaciale]
MRNRSSLDPTTASATSPLRSTHGQPTRGPLAPRSSNYHTSPAIKSMLMDSRDSRGNPWKFKVTVEAEHMPTSVGPTARSEPIPLHDAENTQVPDLCPVSQLGDHASTDYSLSEIEYPEELSESLRKPIAVDSLSPEPVRPLAFRRSPASARNRLSTKSETESRASLVAHRTEPDATDGPYFEQDEEAEAVLGASAPGDATMLESEEFSMISVDSLPSRVIGQSSPSQALQATEGDASVNHSYMPSSPPAFVADRRTPVPEDTTPDDPQAPVASQSHDADIATPLRESARKSGRALQDALNGPFRESVPRELPAARESIFNGFSSGTRRQLHQSLHTGQNMISPSAIHNIPRLAPSGNTFPNFSSPFQSPVRQQETFDSLPSRLVETTSEQRTMSSTSLHSQAHIGYPHINQTSPKDSSQQEHLETSNVNVQKPLIVQMQSPPRSSPPSEHDTVGSSEKHADGSEARMEAEAVDDDRDIWQEEASRSGIDEEDCPEQTDLFLDNLTAKPRRSKLPGTWRCTSGAALSYSESSEPQESQNRKPSASTMGSSRKSSGVITPPSSDDGSIAAEENPTRHIDNSAKSSVDEELSQSESGDDTGMFFQSNLPFVYSRKTRRHDSDSAKSSFAPSSPLRNTVLEIGPVKNAQAPGHTPEAKLSAGPSPLRRSLAKSSHSKIAQDAHKRDVNIDTSETQTDSSLASDAQQIHRELRAKSGCEASTISSLTSGSQGRGSRRAASANTIDLTISSTSDQDLSSISSRSRSYQEDLNLASPMRVKVNFNDDAGNSTLLDPRRQYPPLFDNVPTLTKPTTDLPESPQPKSPLLRLTESFWEAVTKPPVYASPERKPSVVLEPASVTTVPDHVLRLRRKYGLLPDAHPFIYAHIRTLHRMLNSTRSRPGSSIVPRCGPLGHGLSRMLGKSKTNELDQRFVWTQTHLHVVDSFMSLLLPQEERDRLQYETGSWGDAEALRHRGRDSKGRYGDGVVFNGVKGGLIEAAWVADVLVDIIFREEMNAKRKKVAEMMARAEGMGM